MKTFLKTLLLITVPCLTGCYSDAPQSVVFSVHELSAGSNPETFTINIIANCPWSITDEKNNTHTETTTGNGNAEVLTRVFTNVDYDDKTYRIIITSEDGTSSDILTIHQKAMTGLEVEKIDTISEEGGVFSVPIKTNDEITEIKTPDWITFTSSRTLTNYTYTFNAEPNKTGSVRKGTITLKGKELTESIEVSQDSYEPTGINLLKDIAYVSEKNFKTKISIEPQYADISKLGIKASEGCTASIENGFLSINLNNYGKYSISFLVGNKNISKKEGEYIPTAPFFNKDTQEAYLGQSNFLRFLYYSEEYILHSSNENIVSIGDDGKPYAVGCGTATVSVIHPKVNCYDELTIIVEPFLATARLAWFSAKSDGSYDVQFKSIIEGMNGFFINGYFIVDNEGKVFSWNQGNIRDLGNELTIETATVNIKYDHSKFHNIMDALYGYVFYVSVTVNDIPYQKYININTHHVG